MIIRGFSTQLYLFVAPATYPASFVASGPGAFGGGWSVRLGNATQGALENRSSFLAANGTYTFDVHPPAGEYAVPSHGQLVVAGAGDPTPIRFYPSSERPSAALVAELTSGAIGVSIWLGASVFTGFVLVRAFRNRGA